MTHNIIPDLVDKAVPVKDLIPLKRNPHVGDVDAVKAVLVEFGQHMPILVNKNSNEVIAGNTRLRAAKELGWTHVAATFVDEDDARSLARAVSDNRVAELGKDDPNILAEILPNIIEDYADVYDVLGWDEWEVAALEEGTMLTPAETGYTPPPPVRRDPVAPIQTQNEDGSDHFQAPPGVDQRDIIQRGAGETDPKRATVIHYTLAFDDADQQRRWYQFLTWLRNDPELTQYGTTAEKLLAFLEERADF